MEFIAILDEYLASVEEERKQGTGATRHDATTEVRELKSGGVELGAEGRRSSG